ncbi:GNAT family N-acetyltransferase [Lyngbya confervoides]|uniref:GNAT family N-acetyltransferase n=1 Tax=Lyngbya confervoides BDU141951 TaxID=1574623 RepID=A0ABD4T4K9_9CYAN|nr:GNAT family N-acetyltransferase [Lyngbya confervoides]MCM1983419.1 GNAT family N-acetyltransferase [Lyngbya confervoides BDU141951]
MDVCDGLIPPPLAEAGADPVKQLRELFNRAAFWAKDRSEADLSTALAFSSPVISVWNGPQLIGFARATSDGVFRATIWDVVVHPEYRGLGVGRKLLEALLDHPQMRRVERVYLMTTYQQAFYERMGFAENSTTTMVRCAAGAEPAAADLVQDLVSQLQI